MSRSLGAIQTPKVLMQSGIGDESELAKFDIPLIQPLSGVGRNMHDHIALGHVWEGTGTSMPGAPRGQAVSFWKSRPELDAPNSFTYSIPAPFVTPENARRLSLPEHAWSFAFGMRPQSRGSITLTGKKRDRSLEVADASVLPHVTVGNTMAPAVVIGEQAAAFLREEHGS